MSAQTQPYLGVGCTVLVRDVVQSVAVQDHRDLRRYMTEYTVQGFIEELVSPRPGGTMTRGVDFQGNGRPQPHGEQRFYFGREH